MKKKDYNFKNDKKFQNNLNIILDIFIIISILAIALFFIFTKKPYDLDKINYKGEICDLENQSYYPARFYCSDNIERILYLDSPLLHKVPKDKYINQCIIISENEYKCPNLVWKK